jgi:SAM-dependent methyltransferase
LRVLDCGCGNGASVEYLGAAGFDAVGIDVANFRQEQWRARTKLPGVRLIQADATALPFSVGSFDVILSSGMLEHIGVFEECTPEYRVQPLPDQFERRRKFVAECLRVLRPGGTLFIDHPNGRFPIDFWHNDHRSRPRFHSPRQHFLPSFGEVSKLVNSVTPACSIQAISPAGRFTLRRSKRRWYGQIFSGAMKCFFASLNYWPLASLAPSALNPYLVIRIVPNPAAGK